MSDSIRVLIADDHLIVREGLRLILETGEGFELIGEAADSVEAARLAKGISWVCCCILVRSFLHPGRSDDVYATNASQP